MDDASVTKSSKKEALSQKAYLVFYQKGNARASALTHTPRLNSNPNPDSDPDCANQHDPHTRMRRVW